MTPPRMDSEAQIDQLVTMLQASDMFELAPSQRVQRLQAFFSAVEKAGDILKSDENEERWEVMRQKWTSFHQHLCDHETTGDYLACFMSSTLRPDAASCANSILVYKTVVEKAPSSCPSQEMFKMLRLGVGQRELIRALKDNCDKIPSKVTFQYLHVRVLPGIFLEQTSDEERHELCDLVLSLPMGFAMQFMHQDTQTKFKNDVKHKYVKFIYTGPGGSFRSDWGTLCRTLIHYSGKLLHCDTYLQNAILKVIEEAFKNVAVELRCAAFDCWQALIDNYALERKYIGNVKQSLLLLKPLRARISRNRVVASKKYDVYVHLLRRMRFPATAVEKFLSDAFGPFTENVPDSLRMDSVQHFKDLTSSYPQSTEILLKALGHRKDECVCKGRPVWVTDTCGGETMPLDGEVSYEVLVQSVRLCSQLNAISLVNARPEICETLTRCVWSSMYKYFEQSQFASLKKEINTAIETAILKVIHSSAMNANYYNNVFKYILACLADYINNNEADEHVYNCLVLPTIANLLRYPEELSSNMFAESVRPLCTYCESQPEFLGALHEILRMPFLDSANSAVQLRADVLAYCIGRYARIIEKNNYSTSDNEVVRDLFRRLMEVNCNAKVTPTFDRVFIHMITSSEFDLIKIYVNFMIDDRKLRKGFLKILAVTFSFIVNHSMINSEVYINILDLIINCIEDLVVEKLSEVIPSIDIAIDILIPPFERIAAARCDQPHLKINLNKLLRIHQLLLKMDRFVMLKPLSALIVFADKEQMPKGLYDMVTTLTDNTEEEVSNNAFTVLGKIHMKSSTSPLNGGNVDRRKVTVISELVIPPMPSVRIFGKHLDPPSPKTPTRTSTAPKSTSTKSTTPVRPPNLEDISQSAFVAIEKEVIIDKDKLTEHQREALKKRRDMPAMYQDLTQSNDSLMSGQITSAVEDKSEKKETTKEANKVGSPISSEDKEKRGKKRKESSASSSPNEQNSKKTCVETKISPTVDTTPEEGKATAPRKSRLRTEFEKLQIDIVDGDKFFNLSRTRRRKSALDSDFVTDGLSDDSDTAKVPTADIKAKLKDNGKTDTKQGKKERKDKKEIQKIEEEVEEPPKTETTKVKGNDEKNKEDLETSKIIKIERRPKSKDNEVKLGKKDKKEKKGEKEEKDEKEQNEEQEKKVEKGKNDEKEKKVEKGEREEKGKKVEKETKVEKSRKVEKEKKVEKKDGKETNIEKENKSKKLEESPKFEQEVKGSSGTTEQKHKNDLTDSEKEVSDVINTALVEPDSESIIPSSHECKVNLFRLPLYSPTKQELEVAKTRNQKTPVQCASEAIIAKIDFANFKCDEAEKVAVENDETFTLDVLSKSKQEGDAALLDTESFISNKSLNLGIAEETSPVKSERLSSVSLGASPITNDTPSRTKELLDNTLEISPIKTVSCDKTVNADLRASPDLFASQVTGGTSTTQDVFAGSSGSEGEDSGEVQMYFKPEEEGAAGLKNPSSRSAKLLHLVGHSPATAGVRMSSPARNVMENSRALAGTMSPSTGRIRKMMLSCGDASRPGGSEEVHKMHAGDILEFERVVPSPLAVPKVSILKRKIPDTVDEGLSPCAKRKRVNFSDPPTTCEKMYFKSVEEKEKPIALRKKKRFITRLLTPDADPPAGDGVEDDAHTGVNDDTAAVLADVNDAIQSMQQQIDGLDMDGVVPLDTSPSKEDSLSRLPSNPAPELLPAGVLSTAYDDLFPTDQFPGSAPKPPTTDKHDRILKRHVKFLMSETETMESYLKYALENVPQEAVTRHYRRIKDVKEDKGAET